MAMVAAAPRSRGVDRSSWASEGDVGPARIPAAAPGAYQVETERACYSGAPAYNSDMPLHRTIARILISIALVLALGACAPAAPAPAGDAPGAVVAEALAKVAAKDLDGLRGLACAGQEDLIRNQIALPAGIGTDLLPGLDTNALLDAVQVDVSGVKVGEATVDADVAEVPVTGAMNVTFDKVAMRPLLRSMLEAQGMTMTDDQVDGSAEHAAVVRPAAAGQADGPAGPRGRRLEGLPGSDRGPRHPLSDLARAWLTCIERLFHLTGTG